MKLLQGVRILTVEQFGAGPYGSMFLADLGAEVIKVEHAATGGDAARSSGPYPLGAHDSLYFQSFNTNKVSVTIDLKTTDGQSQFRRLATDADVVMNNLRGDLPERLGLHYSALSAVNPKIVCGHISAYGRHNDRADRPGYDFLMQAEAGLMSITGEPNGDPVRTGASMIDFMSGITLDVGILSALLRARETGVGCDVDTCLFDVALHQLSYAATWYLNRGHVAQRLARSSHFTSVPVQTFKASDGWVFVMCMTEKFWRLLAEALHRTDLLEDDRFRDIEGRRRHRDELTRILDLEFERDTRANWVSRLGSIIPISPVHRLEEALDSVFVSETGMVQNVPHPEMSGMRLLANPLRVSGERLEQKACAPLGANNDEFLD